MKMSGIGSPFSSVTVPLTKPVSSSSASMLGTAWPAATGTSVASSMFRWSS